MHVNNRVVEHFLFVDVIWTTFPRNVSTHFKNMFDTAHMRFRIIGFFNCEQCIRWFECGIPNSPFNTANNKVANVVNNNYCLISLLHDLILYVVFNMYAPDPQIGQCHNKPCFEWILFIIVNVPSNEDMVRTNIHVLKLQTPTIKLPLQYIVH